MWSKFVHKFYYRVFEQINTRALNGHGDFQKKKPEVNRYIELCIPISRISNSFLRISNSFPRIGQLVLSDCNTFPRIRQSVPSNWVIQFEGTNCNSRERVVQFEGRNYLSLGTNYSSVGTDCLIRGNELTRLIRENGLSNLRERFAIRENELSNSRERINITIYLWLFLKIPLSLQGLRMLVLCRKTIFLVEIFLKMFMLDNFFFQETVFLNFGDI